MNVRVLQRHLGSAQLLAPGQYTTDVPPASTAKATIACPACGRVSLLELAPLSDGSLLSPWLCPYVCSYQGKFQLEDWAEPVLT